MILAAEVTEFIVLQDPVQLLEDCAAICDGNFELGLKRDVIYDKSIIKTKAFTFQIIPGLYTNTFTGRY